MRKQLLSIISRITLLEAEVGNKDGVQSFVNSIQSFLKKTKDALMSSSFGKTMEERKNSLLKHFNSKELPKDFLTKITGITLEDIESGANQIVNSAEELRQSLVSNLETLMYMETGNEIFLKNKSFFEKTKLILQKYILKDVDNTPEKIVSFLMSLFIIASALLLIGIAIMLGDSAFNAVKKHIFEASSKFGKALRELDPVKSVVTFIKLIITPISSVLVALSKSPTGTIFFSAGVSILGYCGVLLYTYKEYGILK